jgi:hypothetical protein
MLGAAWTGGVDADASLKHLTFSHALRRHAGPTPAVLEVKLCWAAGFMLGNALAVLIVEGRIGAFRFRLRDAKVTIRFGILGAMGAPRV